MRKGNLQFWGDSARTTSERDLRARERGDAKGRGGRKGQRLRGAANRGVKGSRKLLKTLRAEFFPEATPTASRGDRVNEEFRALEDLRVPKHRAADEGQSRGIEHFLEARARSERPTGRNRIIRAPFSQAPTKVRTKPADEPIVTMIWSGSTKTPCWSR